MPRHNCKAKPLSIDMSSFGRNFNLCLNAKNISRHECNDQCARGEVFLESCKCQKILKKNTKKNTKTYSFSNKVKRDYNTVHHSEGLSRE